MTNVLLLILNLIFLVIFNMFFFLLGEMPHNMSVWISYGFIHFAYIMLIATPILTRKSKSSQIMGLTLYSISAAYFIITLIIGTVFILIAPESYTAALLIQLSIAGVYGIILISHMIANEQTAYAEEQRASQIAYVKTATAQLKRILDKVKDKEAKRKVERAYDAVNSSPVKTHPHLAQMEMRILTLVDELDDIVGKGDKNDIMQTAASLQTAVNERNTRLKNFAL